MVGLDVTHQALLTPAHAERLRGAGRVGALVAELLDFYARFHAQHYGWDGSPIHDAVAVAHVIDPALVDDGDRARRRRLRAGELCRGRTDVDLRGRTREGAERHVARRHRRRRGSSSLLLERIASLG